MTVSNLTLNTVAYTYSTDQNGIIGWRASTGGVPAGFPTVSNSFRDPGNAKDPVYRSEWKGDMPVVATVSDGCACVGDILRRYSFSLSVLLPPGGSTAERTDFGLRIKDLTASATFQNELINAVRPV